MSKILLTVSLSAVLISAATLAAAQRELPQEGYIQKSDDPNVLIPLTSLPRPGDAGHFMHTNHLLYDGDGLGPMDPYAPLFPTHGPSAYAATPSGYFPSQIQTAYYGSVISNSAGSGVICIVDAYDYPTALNDFDVFSTQFGLPTDGGTGRYFRKVWPGATIPKANSGWAQEEALDIEWAHAMAPNATIVLVEAKSNSNADLYAAETYAAQIAGCREVSNSWGGGESSGESANDSRFVRTGVTFFASSGDSGGVREYPAASPNVIACGGTSIHLNGSGVRTGLDTAWSGTGCGPSAYEPRPTFQDGIATIVGTKRGIADVSAVADPNTGVAVYDSTANRGAKGWLVFGGTSVACPVLAGIHNSIGHGSDTNAEHSLIYGGTLSLTDVLSGTAGSFSAKAGWDFPTGIGTPNGSNGL